MIVEAIKAAVQWLFAPLLALAVLAWLCGRRLCLRRVAVNRAAMENVKAGTALNRPNCRMEAVQTAEWKSSKLPNGYCTAIRELF